MKFRNIADSLVSFLTWWRSKERLAAGNWTGCSGWPLWIISLWFTWSQRYRGTEYDRRIFFLSLFLQLLSWVWHDYTSRVSYAEARYPRRHYNSPCEFTYLCVSTVCVISYLVYNDRDLGGKSCSLSTIWYCSFEAVKWQSILHGSLRVTSI